MKCLRLLPALAAAVLFLGGCGEDQTAPFALPTATPNTAAIGSDGAAAPPPVAGGGTIHLTLNGDPDSLNPILATSSAALAVNRLLFPSLLGRNPYTGQLGPDNALAASYEASPDGLTYTYTLRPNVEWSDGDPVDAADFKFTYDAILSEQVESPYRTSLANIAGIDVLDPLRVQVRFARALCDGLEALRIPWLPSHLYAPDFTDIMSSSSNTNPAVSAGPFIFQSWTPDENVVLRRNGRYWQGAPAADRLVFHIEGDQTERFARLLDGGADVAPIAPAQMTSAQADPNVRIYSANLDGYDFIALNLANPENPQPGRDESGNRLVQEPHPVLADPSVRQAIARALDYETIIQSIYLGRGYQITANVLPIMPWAYDVTIEPYTYDPNAARQLLESAGWVDTNNDGIRERGQTPLVLGLLVVAGNTIHEQLADLVQDQLNSVGFDITVAPVEASALAAQLLGQRYDMAITGWTELGSDPNDDWLWASEHDRPASDFNFVSYQNAEVDRLLQEANTVPGCRPEDRAPLYKQIQRLIHDDLPYIFVSGTVSDTGYRQDLVGVQPAAWDFFWNIHQWYKAAQP
jgi:peptide/nickel transport system substrate-binding protein